ETRQLLGEAIENSKRLTSHTWIQGKQDDEGAKDYVIKILRLPSSLKRLEAKESLGKREAFSEVFAAM
ncbi:hypothetical protein BY458DRAFT_448413, partial [Sporodiniella umbellata]